ncbi:hypothetical protein ONE63_001777 [Megalurothrips usitatus]|uniref:U-box domain-containing protein n=1 Tax=Megalurothrips usitatus TaxID=439358 RepID=A0AAV7XD89_9NEOP|nr:hypothetical protein ONE63_001777 [Megalurothrips usitatus]
MASPLINLCDPVFQTVISCSTVSSEGYEVTNLLSEDAEKRRNGFMCDRFIKPPVEVTLKFPFDVNIKYIQIGAEVGQQKTSGLDISSSSSPYHSSWCSGSKSSRHQPTSNLPCSPTVERIASIVLSDNEKGVVIYCPLQYGRKCLNPVPDTKVTFVQRSMTWKKRPVIAHTSSLTIRIFRTSGSSVPALGSIEVWGGPSSCMSSHQVAEIMNQWTEAHAKKDPEIKDIPTEVAAPSFCKKLDESLLPDIPEEFLDAITWEIMALPMVLPSGKVVDQQTLDLHAQAEANWGRHPSDPFTGLMFSDGCRPIIDSALKARIDRFLVLNQDRNDLKDVPRTVGRVQPQTHHTVSTFRSSRGCFDSSASNRKRSALGSSSTRDALMFSSGGGRIDGLKVNSIQEKGRNLPSCSSYVKETRPACGNIFRGVPKRPKMTTSFTDVKEKSSLQGDGPITIDDSDDDDDKKLSDDLKSHERKLDDSLDSALKAALSGLPSFVNPPKVLVNECGSCKITDRLFTLPCSHFLCRPCLVEKSKLKPTVCPCGEEFKSSDPVAHHE